MKRARLRALRGVTLLEMMVVVAIVGIVAAIAVPNLSPVVRKQRLYGKAEEVASLLDRARRLAYGKGRCMQVTNVGTNLALQQPDPATGTQANNCVQGNANTLSNMGWSTVQLVRPDSAITFTITDTNSLSEIIFRPNNRLRGDGDLQQEEDGARVEVFYAKLNEGILVKVTPAGRICKVHYIGTPPAQGTTETCP